MAIFDSRVFRVGDEWWAVQVHGGSGFGVGPGRPQIQDETVVFTCLTDENRNSRLGSITAGTLNRLSHRAISEVLRRSSPWGVRLDISPTNAPDPDELGRHPSFTDDDGLRWAVRRTRVKRVTRSGIVEHPAVDVICLDDSALRNEILLENDATYDDALRWATFDINGELAKVVKSMHDEEPPDHDADPDPASPAG